MNLLADRLKFAKRELTALKTAHTRGLGNLRMYVENATIPTEGHETGIQDLTITVTFDRQFTAYPFAYILPTIDSNTNLYAIQAVGFNYANDGFGASFKSVHLPGVGSENFAILSTAPVKSISYDWS